jgi:hypothetical protein
VLRGSTTNILDDFDRAVSDGVAAFKVHICRCFASSFF